MARTRIQNILYFIRWQLYPVVLALPAHLAFLLRGIGKSHCSLSSRSKLCWHSILVHLRLECLHNPADALYVIEDIIELSVESPGVIVECGTYLGGSTAKFSHVAALVGRKLIVCDSFEGLPEVSIEDHTDLQRNFRTGEFVGRLEEVKRNVARYGRLDCVEFVSGWYEESLKQLSGISIACAFWDVDLVESYRSCIKGLWSQINPGAKVFIHEANRTPIVKVFTDSLWWRDHLGIEPPQFLGAHTGLSKRSPSLGYVVKR